MELSKRASRKRTSRKTSVSRNTIRASRKRVSRKPISRKSSARASRKRSSRKPRSVSRKARASRKSNSRKPISRKSSTRASRKSVSRKPISRKSSTRASRKKAVSHKNLSVSGTPILRSPRVNSNIQIFVKDLSGDLIQIEISNTQSVFSLKKMVSDINGMSVEKMKLFSENGDVLSDHLSIGESNIKNEDILFVLNDVPEAPFKGKKYIRINGKKLKGTRKKFYGDEFLNTAVFFSSHEGKSFEGRIDDFMDSIPSSKAQTKIRAFMKDLQEIGENLMYIYYKEKVFYFTLTNEDSSIVYEYHLSPEPERAEIYFRGYLVQISRWKALSIDDRKRLLTDDEFLKEVINA